MSSGGASFITRDELAQIDRVARGERGGRILASDAVSATLSPDGRWFVYSAWVSDDVGMFVQPVPGGSRIPVSTAGAMLGATPRWRPDGKASYYIAADGKLTEVPVESGEGFFQPGGPRELFDAAGAFDVGAGGERFLFARPVPDAAAEASITLIVNWPRVLPWAASGSSGTPYA